MQIFRTPTWVKSFPSESDRNALTSLHKSSWGPLSTPREMNYVLANFNDREMAENAVFSIESQGWKCTIRPQQEASDKFVVEAQKQGYRLTEQNYLTDTAYFTRMARFYRADLDGWYASSNRPGWTRKLPQLQFAIWLLVVLTSFGMHAYQGYKNAHASDFDQATKDRIAEMDAKMGGTSSNTAAANPQAKTVSKYDPNAAKKTYVSESMGVSFDYNANWDLDEVVMPCAGETVPGPGLQDECYVELRFANFTERHAPTMRLTREGNSLADVEKFYDDMYGRTNLNEVHKEHTFVNGKKAVTYVVSNGSSGSLHQQTCIENTKGNKVYCYAGDTPLGGVDGLDYFAEYQKIFVTFKIT